jgi:hypothetical protein
MEVSMEHIEMIKNKDGSTHYFNPVDRIEIDMKHLKEISEKVIEAYNRKIEKQSSKET